MIPCKLVHAEPKCFQLVVFNFNIAMEILNSCRIVFFLLILCAAIKCEDQTNQEEEEDLFVPTQEWQVVKEGQKLKKGLHIRINLTTGKKEAKFLDASEENVKAVQTVKTNEDAGDLKNSEAGLKEALKNIKSDETESAQGNAEHLNKFRSYEELKQEMLDINLFAKSDFEVLNNLVEKLKKLTNAKQNDTVHILNVMEDIDYLIHQYDNAIEFVRLKGFEDIIYKNLNSSILEIKLENLKLLGSLVQNNAKVQIYALETGAIDHLLRMLVLNTDHAVKSRTVFALSSLIRRFPLAQLKFVENAGLNVFFDLVTSTKDMKIQLKIVTLINDLVLEYIEALDDHMYPEKIEQYNRIELKHKLDELNWCKYLTGLLKNIYKIDKTDHDGIEKALNAILSVIDHCRNPDINSIQVVLKKMQRYYNKLAINIHADDELGRDYYEHMETLCAAIINYNNVINIKTEL